MAATFFRLLVVVGCAVLGGLAGGTDDAPEVLGFAGMSFGLGPRLPHDALPCAEAEPFFPLTPEGAAFSVAAESRDGGSEVVPFVGAAVISKSISVSSA